MKNEDVIILALAGLACWFILQGRKTGNGWKMPAEYGAKKAAPDYQGWQYFTDGTAISPEGDYYLNGELVWSKPA